MRRFSFGILWLMVFGFMPVGVAQPAVLPEWEVHWYRMKQPGVFGDKIGIGSFPFVFERDWGYREVYNDYADYIGFKAFLDLEIPAPVKLRFVVGADDGIRLYIDGQLVIDSWERGSYREFARLYSFSVGRHRLELHYFEWTGVAKVRFYTDLQSFQSAVIEGKIENLTRLLVELQGAIQSAIQKVAKQLSEQRSDINDVINKLQQLLALKTQVEALQKELEDLEKEVQTMADNVLQQFQNLEEKQLYMATKISELENQLGKLTQVIKTELLVARDSWVVYWYEMVAPGVFGKALGSSFFPLNFFFNWGYGTVFQNLHDHVGFKAYAKIYLPADTVCRFKVFANNCFALYIDGKKALDHWGMGEALSPEEKVFESLLAAGEHELELHYYEWEGEAWIGFYQW
ncbi:MAG: hypothetical protein ACPLRP_01865 [Candidatus Bipolaricaulaceae bacterium]